MKSQTHSIRTKMHFTANYLISPTNPVSVNLIGAGGTGSRVLTALGEISHALTELGHPGLAVRMFDDDVVTKANLGRQRFAQSELGLKKSVARINNTNRFFGTNWKAIPYQYSSSQAYRFTGSACANIFISCVDTVAARMEIAAQLDNLASLRNSDRERPFYWIDYGNSRDSGQVILSTVGSVAQPASKKFSTVEKLPFITDEYTELLQRSETTDNTPSCSLAEALQKQDLFINASLAQLGSSLLWGLFRNGMTENRGFFFNLRNFRCQPLKVA